jgi:two-component system, sensor histidine kinase
MTDARDLSRGTVRVLFQSEKDSLEARIAKLEKINAALISRVERSMDHQLNAFALFETAIALEGQVRRRTTELQETLRSLEHSNRELFQSKTQAEAANLSKTTFLASLSHDLLQPLNAARLATSALSEIQMGKDGLPLIGQVERSLATLEDLIRTLLDISKIEAGVLKPEPRAFAVTEILEPLAQEFAHIAQRRGLRLTVRATRAIVYSDPLMLRRIVQNLLSNALRYTRHGGVVLGCRPQGNDLRIEVVDTGPGIPIDRSEEIFEAFKSYNTTLDGETGFGLGLAIVRHLALAMDHPIGLRSRVDHGSTFSVCVPRFDGPAPLKASEVERAGAAPHYGVGEACVLLIENEPAVAEAMETLLTRWGCEVISAASSHEAIDMLVRRDNRRAPDLIISDLHLDNSKRGYDAIDDVHEYLQQRVPAFVITADHSGRSGREIEARGFEVLKKPVKPAELRSLIAYLLA